MLHLKWGNSADLTSVNNRARLHAKQKENMMLEARANLLAARPWSIDETEGEVRPIHPPKGGCPIRVLGMAYAKVWGVAWWWNGVRLCVFCLLPLASSPTDSQALLVLAASCFPHLQPLPTGPRKPAASAGSQAIGTWEPSQSLYRCVSLA